MPTKITITQPDISEVSQAIGDIEGAWVKDGTVKQAWDRWHTLATEITEKLFETQGSSGAHGSWQAYTPQEGRWAAFKAKVLGAQEAGWLLMWGWKKGRLGPSMWNKTDQDHIFEVSHDGTRATFGTKIGFATEHDEGSGRIPEHFGSANIVRRRVWDPTEHDQKKLSEILHDAITESYYKRVGESLKDVTTTTRRK